MLENIVKQFDHWFSNQTKCSVLWFEHMFLGFGASAATKQHVPGTLTPWTVASLTQSVSTRMSATSAVAMFSPFHLLTFFVFSALCELTFLSIISKHALTWMCRQHDRGSTWNYPHRCAAGRQCWSTDHLSWRRCAASFSQFASCLSHNQWMELWLLFQSPEVQVHLIKVQEKSYLGLLYFKGKMHDTCCKDIAFLSLLNFHFVRGEVHCGWEKELCRFGLRHIKCL